MANKERLDYCKRCLNRKYDFNQGIVCGLTMQKPTFESNCGSFIIDENENVLIKNTEFKLTYAGRGVRLLNYLIDILVLLIIIGTLRSITGSSVGNNWLSENVFRLVIIFIYYVVFELLTGKTIGKMITGTKVVLKNGDRAELSNIVIRTLCRFIPFEAFSFLGSDAYGWHDEISKTIVIKIKR